MAIDQTTQRYMFAGATIIALTIAALVMLTSRDDAQTPPQVDAAEDILENAVITAVSVAQSQPPTAPQPTPQDTPQPAAQPTTAQPNPQPQPREDQVMANPGPDYAAASVPVPAENNNQPTGTVDREGIRNVIQGMRPLVKNCYLETLNDFPEAEGKVVLAFTIAAEDGVGRVELSELDPEKTTLIDTFLHDCIQEALAEQEFPVPDGNGRVNVRYPFAFENKPKPAEPAPENTAAAPTQESNTNAAP